MIINRYFGKYFEAGGKLPLIGIIFTKADLFSHDTNYEEIRETNCGEVESVNIHLPIFLPILFLGRGAKF